VNKILYNQKDESKREKQERVGGSDNDDIDNAMRVELVSLVGGITRKEKQR